jgi:hypothetical protein
VKLRQYLKEERAIALADQSGIMERWRYGRLLLTDPEMTTPGGNLKDGVIERLIKQATAGGRQLSRREIQYRLQAGKVYPTEPQLRNGIAQCESWFALTQAGFPEVPRPEGAEDFDPRAAKPARRTNHSEGYEPEALFPADKFNESSTLREMQEWAASCREWTERQAERDDARDKYLAKLVRAAGGNLDQTWGDVQGELDLWGDESSDG